jgi:hypothetical protein
MFDWNGIDEEIANGVDEYAAVEPIGNIHVNEETPVRSESLAYDRADEEADDDDYNEVANEHGTEDGNAHDYNGDGNDRSEVVVLELQLVATMMQPPLAVRMVDPVMFPRNYEPKKLQDIPPPSNMNANSQVLDVAIPAVINTNYVDNEPLSHIVTSVP